MEERKFYSKLCVARSLKSSVGKRCLNEFVPSGWDKLSYNLATILVKDKVVVAVNLRVLSNRCEISIAKDGVWLEEDHKYVNKIKETLANISKDAPMTFKQTHSREDMIDLSSTILNYCSKIIRNRSDKLRKSITENKDENYIKSFLEFVKTRINVDDIYNDEKIVSISTVCCEWDHALNLCLVSQILYVKQNTHLFSHMDLQLLDPVVMIQPILPWNDIVKEFVDQVEYGYLKEACLKDSMIKRNLKHIYGGINVELNCESSNEIYLHPILNILTSVMNHEEKRIFIAVSKRTCFLCDLYIRFVRDKGYNIIFSGSQKFYKKLYNRWKLPDRYKEEFMSFAQLELDQIIGNEIKYELIYDSSDDEALSMEYDEKEFERFKNMPFIRL
ncbi:uncharacterized protein OCT59_022860 [Rhizophagus irregularis]|uniref:Uncharacterized protein n=2 Tax=Rhizophagus irregularis TaxID=588596 RepID=A0A015K1Q8_RHIIW|nr:hypothetical protein GLOIN_2v1788089 [Rhizophagus irregularis DAOM 181602=DAOM 197198]EXX61319.1 hypothetical protein RirG_172270 [Rhizophagus irregularis DAOM 197198w]POG60294.1 hypothetical protein GLOIN_2v1788089 [Rhizophagus irregularis DAOM 181602=DAOM 197198]UZO29382.1 hypothetical protein OCT59_022860 [Rhizophagus irregularis]|eukprot:XP_025167160.1 hypothetical protein GLOIN_2v1788089 [Rhizophagus irregularis DAOM 181602=DAOM 197198]